MTALLTNLRALLADAITAYAGTPEQERLVAVVDRLDEPLRVAIAGRVKAGKSTLLNALVGEHLAATDAGECTRVVTWYASGVASRVWAYPHDGEPRQLPFHRSDGKTDIQLGDLRAEDLDRLRIEVPNSRLERLTLIDTPGIGSLSTEVSARTTTFLAGATDRGADAVLYLMRHLHASDVSFLEAFHDQQFAGTTPVNAIGVLSRADEIGAGRGDALDLARQAAAGYRRDPRVRALMQTVVPVAGLLGQAGSTLREREYAALRAIAADAPARVEMALLSADRFVAPATPLPVPPEVRRDLLGLLGLFGVRLGVTLLRHGLATDAGVLAAQLRDRSGLDELRAILLDQFTRRRDVLKAYGALRALETVLANRPVPAAERLGMRLEALLVGAHELTELRLLNDLRTGAVELPTEERRDDAEALLGAAGSAVRGRLRLPAETPDAEIRPALIAALRRWQAIGESPVASPTERRVAGVLRRTCEGLLAGTART
ncbi:MAG TPA: dynamin family protein [Micromonosporaceae bacterium]|nr:dynamin family protein [Micromonosporaceae bacterium]